MKLARLNHTSCILIIRDKYNSYNVNSINVLSHLTILNTIVFKFKNNGAQFNYIAFKNCLANRIKKTTLSYNFDTIRVFNISPRQFLIK
jgi:hypothetical protein